MATTVVLKTEASLKRSNKPYYFVAGGLKTQHLTYNQRILLEDVLKQLGIKVIA
jgi:hypothetical protein